MHRFHFIKFLLKVFKQLNLTFILKIDSCEHFAFIVFKRGLELELFFLKREKLLKLISNWIYDVTSFL